MKTMRMVNLGSKYIQYYDFSASLNLHINRIWTSQYPTTFHFHLFCFSFPDGVCCAFIVSYASHAVLRTLSRPSMMWRTWCTTLLKTT